MNEWDRLDTALCELDNYKDLVRGLVKAHISSECYWRACRRNGEPVASGPRDAVESWIDALAEEVGMLDEIRDAINPKSNLAEFEGM